MTAMRAFHGDNGDHAVARSIRWHYLWYVALALAVMIAAIVSDDRWFLNFVHVISGVLWTGIDLFMGFIVGPVLRIAPASARREIILRLVPRTLFLMPTLATITGTTGWYLAEYLGYFDLAVAAVRLGRGRAGTARADDDPGHRHSAADQSLGLLPAAEADPTTKRSAG